MMVSRKSSITWEFCIYTFNIGVLICSVIMTFFFFWLKPSVSQLVSYDLLDWEKTYKCLPTTCYKEN